IGDGLLRTVDPITIARAVVDLAAPIHASHSFPILTTAFGDVVTEWRSRLYLINARVGRYIGLGRAGRLAQVVTELADPQRRTFLLGRAPWAEAVGRLGVPTPLECFAYVPPLSVLPRGEGELTGIERVGLREHLAFLAAFHGPAQGRWCTGEGADYNHLWLTNLEEGRYMSLPALSPLDPTGVEAAVESAMAAIGAAATLEELKEVRIAHTGDKSPLALANRAIKDLAKEDKSLAGKTVGQARGRVNKAIAERQLVLEEERD